MIIVFGSLNIDLVMAVSRLPQPGETVLCPSYVLKPGGKGANQAVAAARAGGRVALYGQVGSDDFGRVLVENLRANEVAIEGVALGDRPTGCAAICVDAAGENAIAVASGANLAAAAAQVPDAALGTGSIVVLQMEVPHEQNWALIGRAHALGARTLLNVAPAGRIPRAVLADLDLLVVNEIEAGSVAADLGIAAAEPRALARELARVAGVTCIMTLGAEGAIAGTPDGPLWRVPALPITPVDTTGAGDAFCGVLAAALDAGRPLPDALRWASVGAALSCLAMGAQESLPRAAAIAARLAELPEPQPLP